MKSCFKTLIPFVLLLVFSFMPDESVEAGGPDWAQWGGPKGDFTVDSKGLADSWPKSGPKRIWERPLGEGYSSVVVKDDRLYTMIHEEKNEVVVGLDAKTGETIWEHRYETKFWPDMTLRFGPGPNATPAIADDRLVTIGISGDLRCLDLATGKLLWRHDLPAEYGRQERDEEYGYSNSPVLYQGKLIVFVNGTDHGVVAFDPADGTVLWKSESSGVSYAQAATVTIDGHDQIVFFSFSEVIGLDPKDGRFLWSHPSVPGNGNNLTPVFLCGERHLWVSTQFDQGGGRVLELKKVDGQFEVKEIWHNSRMRSTHWTSIPIGDYLYGSIGGNSTSLLCAVNWRTGGYAWRRRGFHKCLCLYADDKLIFLDEFGMLAMAKVSPDDLEILASAQVAEGVSWTVPTLVGTTLYVRDRKNLIALDLSVGSSGS